MNTTQPLLRWAGGKRKLATTICDLFPSEFWESQGRYFEPFLGGGAVALSVASQCGGSDRLFLSDCNDELINLYTVVQNQPENLIEYLKNSNYTNSSNCYYEVRSQVAHDPVSQAARTLYLNATCFNGLYRTNSQGGFNVPFGKLNNPDIHKIDLIRKFSSTLKKATFSVCNFDELEVAHSPDNSDLVYFDPPYIPISITSSFTTYAKDGFGLDAQKQLSTVIKRLVDKGVSVVLSNSDTEDTRKIFGDTGLTFYRVSMSRSISAQSTSRGNVYEVLATNVPLKEVPMNMEPIQR
jgi:DNA adenine methylase